VRLRYRASLACTLSHSSRGSTAFCACTHKPLARTPLYHVASQVLQAADRWRYERSGEWCQLS
jgi:hypothetical protein